MGSRELVEGLLWRARAGIRVEGSLRAGHGMADASYRPPALPYASVIGPLNIELEPDRDPPRTIFLPVQAPGYLAGAERVAADLVPAPGDLTLRIDGDIIVVADVDLGALAGESMTADGVGPAVAEVLEQAIRTGDFHRQRGCRDRPRSSGRAGRRHRTLGRGSPAVRRRVRPSGRAHRLRHARATAVVRRGRRAGRRHGDRSGARRRDRRDRPRPRCPAPATKPDSRGRRRTCRPVDRHPVGAGVGARRVDPGHGHPGPAARASRRPGRGRRAGRHLGAPARAGGARRTVRRSPCWT